MYCACITRKWFDDIVVGMLALSKCCGFDLQLCAVGAIPYCCVSCFRIMSMHACGVIQVLCSDHVSTIISLSPTALRTYPCRELAVDSQSDGADSDLHAVNLVELLAVSKQSNGSALRTMCPHRVVLHLHLQLGAGREGRGCCVSPRKVSGPFDLLRPYK